MRFVDIDYLIFPLRIRVLKGVLYVYAWFMRDEHIALRKHL